MIILRKLMTSAFLAIVGVSYAQKVIFKEDFGKSTTRQSSQYVPSSGKDNNLTNFKHGTSFYRLADKYLSNLNELPSSKSYTDINNFNQDVWNIDNGFYAVIAPSHIYDMSKKMPDGNNIPWAGSWWYNSNYKPVNHTDNSSDGAVLVVNGGEVLNQFYRRVVKLEPNKSYRISAYIQGAGSVNVGINFEAQNIITEQVLGSSNNDKITGSQVALIKANTWEQKYWVFKTPSDNKCLNIAIALRNNVVANNGNDFFVDDIVLEEVESGGAVYECDADTNVIIDNIIKANDDEVNLSSTSTINIIDNDTFGEDGTKIILSGSDMNATIGKLGNWPEGVSLNNSIGEVSFTSEFIAPAEGLRYQICSLIGVCSSATITFNSGPKQSYCTKSPNTSTPVNFTNVGVSTLKTQTENWPHSIPNGFIALESSNKGFVITRVADVNKIMDAKEGMIVYDKTDNCVKLYNGSEWKCINRSCNE